MDTSAPAPPAHAASLQAGRRAAIPNILTLSRVALALLCFVCLEMAWPRVAGAEPRPSLQGSSWLASALVLFVLAAATDFLDGHLARKWKVVSRFGRVMDPFADKLLVMGTFILLAHPRFWEGMNVPLGAIQLKGIQGWMVVVMLGRELLVTSLRGVYEADGVDFSATFSGKIKMVLQSICAPLAMLVLVVSDNPVPRGVAGALAAVIWATVIFSAISGVPYALRAFRAERRTTT